ncbi:MAG: AhpC/TSA family protein, partial [Proteobacteria bacterium]|nr:AhpC/TSA family protein [Pseudomonadota bacterium]
MPHSLLPTTLALVLASSLVCSTAIRHGHADVPIAATAGQVAPLQAGDDAPRFTVRTVDNRPFEFDPLSLERAAVLISFRGGWCPYCNLHLSELRHVVPELADMGIDVLFLSGDRPGLLYAGLARETQEDIAGLDYTILSDADAQAAMALGTAFEASAAAIDRLRDKGGDIEGSSMARQGVLPVPSVFVVDAGGRIVFAHVNADYKVRLAAQDLL